LDASRYPASRDELADWARRNTTTAGEARRRFAQYVVLVSISSSAPIAAIAFKGGNALQFIHGNPRSTLDLDFTADAGFPDDPAEIKARLDASLPFAERRHQVKARCQSIHRKPPGMDRTTPTYSIKVGYQLSGDRYYQNFDERKMFSDVVEVEISLNDVVCETQPWQPEGSARELRACTLEDILAEKLRAMLQQIPRNRSRPQDVFDVASMVRRYPSAIDPGKVSAFLVRKAAARGITASKAAFDGSVLAHAAIGYDAQIRPFTTQFIPLDEAWSEVLGFVSRLEIPDR